MENSRYRGSFYEQKKPRKNQSNCYEPAVILTETTSVQYSWAATLWQLETALRFRFFDPSANR